MATRLIGTDDADPRLPASVIAATQGATADDLAPGDVIDQANAYTDTAAADAVNAANEYTDTAVAEAGGGGGSGGFVGAFTSTEAPDPTDVPAGHYYFDLTLNTPYWSTGAAWVGSGEDAPPPPVELTVGFTAVAGQTFAPWVGLTSPTTVTWRNSTGTVLATGIQPSFTVPTNGIINMNVEDETLVDFINFGYDNTQDVGDVSLPESYNWPPTSLTGVTTPLSEIPNIRYFMAADTELTGHLDIAGHPHLEHIECFHAHVETTDLTGCTALVRLCFETNDLVELDLTPVRLTLADLRCADQAGVTPVDITCTGELATLGHYCVQGNAGGADVPLSQMPVVHEWWVWDKGLTTLPGDGSMPVSPLLSSIIADNNPWTTTVVGNLLETLAELAAGITDIPTATQNYQGSIVNPSMSAAPATANGARALLLSRGWLLTDVTTTGDLTSDGVWPANTKDGTATGWARVGSGTAPAVYNDNLTAAWTGYSRIQRVAADAASTANPTFTVTADRDSFNGTFWGMYCRADASGNNGARVMLTGTTGAISSIGLSNTASTGNATVTTLASVPAGWTNPGAHTMSMTLATNQITVALDGTNVYRATPAPSGGTWGGYYFGFCGNPGYVSRSWTTISGVT